MAFNFLHYQPIHFLEDGEKATGNQSAVGRVPSDFCQPVIHPQETCVQINLTEVDGVDLITDGDFNSSCGVNWTCGGDWDISGGKAIVNSAAGTNILSQPVVAKDNTIYFISLEVSDYVSGDTPITINGGNPTFIKTGNGKRTAMVLSGSSGNDIQIFGSVISDMKIDVVTCIELSTLANFDLITKDDPDFIPLPIASSSITYGQTSPAALLCLDWSDIDINTKVEVLINDGIDLITNGTFTGSAAGWDLGAIWLYSANKVNINDNGNEAAKTLSQPLTLKAGMINIIGIDISGYVAGSINIKAGENAIGNISPAGNGSFVVYLDMRQEKEDADTIRIVGQIDGFFTILSVDNVTLITAFVSECVCVQEKKGDLMHIKWDQECPDLQGNPEARNAYGFLYADLNFSHHLYLNAYIGEGTPVDIAESTQTVNVAGDSSIPTGQLQTQLQLITTTPHIPLYIAEAVFAASRHNMFLINDIRHFSVEKELAPDWTINAAVSTFRLTIRKSGIDQSFAC